MKDKLIRAGLAALLLAGVAAAQDPVEAGFETVGTEIEARLAASLDELAQLRERIADETVPLSRRLGEVEAQLSAIRAEYQDKVRLVDRGQLDLSKLRDDVGRRRDECSYLSNLLTDYIREFEAGLHIVEVHRYADRIDAAKLAPENDSLSEREVFEQQVGILAASIDRLDEALGGTRYQGTAVDANGTLTQGTFVLVGPVAVFRSADGSQVGSVEQRVGSFEPTAFAFDAPEDLAAASAVIATGSGSLPIDPTLGNARKIAATEDTFFEHVQKGGPVMVPIFAMAAAALLVALYRWIGLVLTRVPSRKQVAALIDDIEHDDREAAELRVNAMVGPVGKMLRAGVQHLDEPRELVEEAMYETVLTTRIRLQRLLPFIAICAASAPLLGLLGTVTGIINTFKLITVFGSSDVKMLSGGISEALITTKFGLIVAVPSLLMHAYLSRKARAISSRMETTAVAFLNRIAKVPGERSSHGLLVPTPEANRVAAADPEMVRSQVKEILGEMLGPLVNRQSTEEKAPRARAVSEA